MEWRFLFPRRRGPKLSNNGLYGVLVQGVSMDGRDAEKLEKSIKLTVSDGA